MELVLGNRAIRSSADSTPDDGGRGSWLTAIGQPCSVADGPGGSHGCSWMRCERMQHPAPKTGPGARVRAGMSQLPAPFSRRPVESLIRPMAGRGGQGRQRAGASSSASIEDRASRSPAVRPMTTTQRSVQTQIIPRASKAPCPSATFRRVPCARAAYPWDARSRHGGRRRAGRAGPASPADRSPAPYRRPRSGR
jgi:hypothetical protein